MDRQRAVARLPGETQRLVVAGPGHVLAAGVEREPARPDVGVPGHRQQPPAGRLVVVAEIQRQRHALRAGHGEVPQVPGTLPVVDCPHAGEGRVDPLNVGGTEPPPSRRVEVDTGQPSHAHRERGGGVEKQATVHVVVPPSYASNGTLPRTRAALTVAAAARRTPLGPERVIENPCHLGRRGAIAGLQLRQVRVRDGHPLGQ